MNIGIAAENRPSEKRVILRPQELKAITGKHNILAERGAGQGIGIKDSEYEQAGAKVVSKEEVYSQELVVRLKEPNEEELRLMKAGSYIMSMMHLAGNLRLKSLLEKYKIKAIAMEEIKDPLGRRMIEALHEAGYLAMETGFKLWKEEPSKATVKVMGYGNVASGAIQCAARKFAKVEVLNKRDFKDMSKHIPDTDILVNGIRWPHELRGKVFIITRSMLKLFKRGAVIVDIVSNPAGQSPIETMHPTSLDDISYIVDGIIHTSCWAWPGLDPVNISRKYSTQVAPILKDIACGGFDDLPEYIRAAVC